MIRNYRASDFPAIETIFNISKKDEFLGEDFDVVAKPLGEDKQMLGLLNQSDLYVYKKDSVVGFSGTSENRITWLSVHPEYRRNNIARELVHYALSTLQGEVRLNVARSNKAATSLYMGLGFEIEKEFMGNYQNYPIIVWQMKIVI